MTAPSSVIGGPDATVSVNEDTFTVTATANVAAGIPLLFLSWSSGDPISFTGTDSTGGNTYTAATPEGETAAASAMCGIAYDLSPLDPIISGTTTFTGTCTSPNRPFGFEVIQCPGYSGGMDGSPVGSASNTAFPVAPGTLSGLTAGDLVVMIAVLAEVSVTAVSGLGSYTLSPDGIMSAVGSSATRQAYWCYNPSSGTSESPSQTPTGGTGTPAWASIALALKPTVAAISGIALNTIQM